MEFKYCIDPNADEPILTLMEDIGVSTADDGTVSGISGSQFSTELLALDAMGKKTIHMWINSVGGAVIDAQAIFGAMMKIKAKVNTHNLGLAASSAGFLFAAGRVRFMADYAIVMVHDVHSPDGKEDASLIAFRNSVNTMLSERTGKSPEEITLMMSEEVWMNAEEAKASGFCDVIEKSSESNKPRLKKGEPTNSYNKAKAFINKAYDFNPIQLMKKVTNKLNIVEAANEDQIVEAITSIENRATKAEAENKVSAEALKKAEDAVTAATEKYDAMKKEFDEMKNKVDAEAKVTAEKEEKELEDKVGNLVTNAVNAGKIQNKAEAIENWKKLAKADFEGTKNALDAIAVNKKAGTVVNALTSKDGEKPVMTSAAHIMADISNRHKQRG